jgi:DNA-directed RNA polymerase specialized sigma24 family protein
LPDASVISALYASHRPYAYRVVANTMRRTRLPDVPLIDDIVQDAFILLLTSKRELPEDIGGQKGFLVKALRWAWGSHWRKQSEMKRDAARTDSLDCMVNEARKTSAYGHSDEDDLPFLGTTHSAEDLAMLNLRVEDAVTFLKRLTVGQRDALLRAVFGDPEPGDKFQVYKARKAMQAMEAAA